MIVAKLSTDLAKKEITEIKARQSKRAQEIADLEAKIKALTVLVEASSNGLAKAVNLLRVISPETANHLNKVVETINEQKQRILTGNPKS